MAMNVGFLRGSQNSLNNLSTYKEGSFYLTSDTNRLYFAQSSTSLVDLNQYIVKKTYNEISAIANPIEGDFYYATDRNILMVRHGGTWVQINPDTTLTANNQNISVEQVTPDKEVKVSDAVQDSRKNTSQGNFNLVAGDNVHLSVDGNKITISTDNDTTNTTYDLEAVKNDKNAEIHLKSSDSNEQDDVVKLKLSDGGSLDVANNTIDIAIPSKIKASLEFSEDGQLVPKADPRAGNSKDLASVTVTPKIKLGDNAEEYKFASGTATLPVYTKTETDQKITDALAAADALTYKGTVSSTDASTKIIKTANVGEVYKAATNISVPVDGKTITAKTGDLLISEGTDGAVTWVVVPSGDDQTISGEVGGAKIIVKDQSALIAGMQLLEGTHIEITDSTEGKLDKVTISQKADYTAQSIAGSDDVTLSSASKSKNPTSASFTALTDLTTDAYGNVTGAETHTFTVVDSHANISMVASGVTVTSVGDKDTATITTAVTDTDTISKNDTFALSSTSLEITAAGTASKEAAINLVWGTF